MQKLIQPLNDMILTASMKTDNYRAKFKFNHYGIDCISKTNQDVWAQGNGEILLTGFDSTLGNVIIIKYSKCYLACKDDYFDVIARYCHLAKILINKGAINKDSKIGIYGATGYLQMSPHLHLEFDLDTKYFNYSPTSNGSIIKKGNDISVVNPLDFIYTKTSAPDNQKYSTVNDSYILEIDKRLGIVN